MPGKPDIYSNDLDGALYHEEQQAEYPEEFWDALREADADMEEEEEEEEENEHL